MSLAVAPDGRSLWLASDNGVSAFADGVWTVPEPVPGDDLVLTLAPAGSDIWAFGLEGKVWRRQPSGWAAVAAPIAADMYDAAADAAGEVWAVGFDYATEQGVLYRSGVRQGVAYVEAGTWAALKYRTLRAVAVDADGGLWVGGCDYVTQADVDTPFMMRRSPDGSWRVVPVPLSEGCVYDLSFNPAGLGIAAAGGDLLFQSRPGPAGDQPRSVPPWQRFEQAPPSGRQWVRVAAVDPVAGGQSGSKATAWAVAGVPTWNGFDDGQAPWAFDGTAWAEADVDDLGFGLRANPDDFDAHPFAGLASDGRSAWSVGRVGQTGNIEGRAVLWELVDGTARLAHPFMTLGGEGVSGDIEARPTDHVWVASSQGAAPFLHRDGSGWHRVPEVFAQSGPRPLFQSLDLAPDGTGWALGVVRRPSGPGDGPRSVAWRLDGSGWVTAPPPPGTPAPVQLQAIANGRAWSLAAAGDGSAQLSAFEGGAWAWLPGAPPAPPTPTANPTPLTGEQAAHRAGRAPFDAVEVNGQTVGWLAASEGHLYRFANGTFSPAPAEARGRVLDLRLAGPRAGWAIAVDTRRAAATPPAARLFSGVLWRLQDAAWREVELRPADFRSEVNALPAGFDVHWLLLSAVGPEEAWLYGAATSSNRPPVNLLVGIRRGRPPVVLPCTGTITALSAVPVLDAAGGPAGTDIWLLGEGPCGTPLDPRLAPRAGDPPRPNAAYLANHAGPVGRVRVRPVADRAFLPDVRAP